MKPLYYLVDDGCRGEPPRRGAPPVAGLGNDWGTRQYLPDDVQAPTYAQRVKADLPGSTGVRDLDPREISEAAFGDDRVIGERMAFRGDDGRAYRAGTAEPGLIPGRILGSQASFRARTGALGTTAPVTMVLGTTATARVNRTWGWLLEPSSTRSLRRTGRPGHPRSPGRPGSPGSP